ncbi:ABC transporter permease OS=Tsukamurella paurometabola (strain ATCC 8368 / DSM / CCUG 35730/ CIP 100753 / JCM 10117 / KCTC 9821 / NBRC 16120 / NCIMB 702349/ NCTC 13040) OX=521096 GN=Tpau_3741 PE=4 SV=1 [Tsukamurella paurometabola]|uniref:ABC transporter permease n=1 Tax=Tsukamurella paurometabola (strain ATCC 8368 / DSM 20162 / CCUG 35730 / CIP 100753 / JCM 10117 / KCTC 9821 / NBRC 16120 / NCIMB 702349 / NCTC 13040) TaxID=521096 RepID=D5UYL6_TSUPD|nr:ABC transporter permease [Tsukamurella paurometabola]ADG80319.1 ABC transporter permease [Tsukamurella paurometabola DSM 20162]SUP39237.1 ABC-2 family transporter protein [Tsukamurella paurometabola]
MIVRAARAEWVKLSTVRATRWTLAASIAFGLFIVVLVALVTRNSESTTEDGIHLALAPFTGLGGIPGIAVIFSAVIGILSVTSEIRFNTIRTTFLAVSHRPVALVAKTVVVGVVCAVAFFLAEVVAMAVFLILGGGGAGFSPFGDGASVYITLPIAAALASTLGLAVGTAVRNAAGAITLLLAYMMVVESVIVTVPQTRGAAPYLPMTNFENFLGTATATSAIDFPWPPVGSLVYLIVVIGLLWVGSVALITRRDA